jgi:SAM-dependent methyltransferase
MLDIPVGTPEPFEKTGGSIWTDPWIQKNMLAAHLDPTHDAASRRAETIDATVAWISRLVPDGGAILDLGCGPGLYAERFAERGFRVTGIDFNGVSIAHARAAQNGSVQGCGAAGKLGASTPVTYVEGDYVKDFPPGRFDAVIMIYCDMGTHSDAERDGLFARALECLNPGGILVFDVFDESILRVKTVGRVWDYSAGPGFWDERPHLVLTETFHYPAARAFCYRHTVMTGDAARSFNVWERYYSRRELGATLARAGFDAVRVLKGMIKRESFVGAEAIFAVARKSR